MKDYKLKSRVFCLVLSFLVLLLPIRAYAATSRNEVGRFVVEVTCAKDYAEYVVTERGSSSYPTGKGWLVYSAYGERHSKQVFGTSYSSHWYARHTRQLNQILIKAVISAYGTTLTATNSK